MLAPVFDDGLLTSSRTADVDDVTSVELEVSGSLFAVASLVERACAVVASFACTSGLLRSLSEVALERKRGVPSVQYVRTWSVFLLNVRSVCVVWAGARDVEAA